MLLFLSYISFLSREVVLADIKRLEEGEKLERGTEPEGAAVEEKLKEIKRIFTRLR